VVKYLGFYPETVDRQKITWVGTLLTGTAKAWDLHQHKVLGDQDTWVNYSRDIQAEYRDAREAATAQHKLGQLKYTGNIRAYFTEFRALNVYTRATGEGLQEKVNLAMPSSILKMRFSFHQGSFATDEHFLQATYNAGLQVEELKPLEETREKSRIRGKGDSKEGQRSGKGSGRHRNGQEVKLGTTEKDHKQSKQTGSGGQAEKPGKETESSAGKCGRCLRPGHGKDNCWAKKNVNGTEITSNPTAEAPAGFFDRKTSGAQNSSSGANKRKRGTEDEAQERPSVQKQVKTSAARGEDSDMRDLPIWAESPHSDF
jgi:hypothetical protein